MEKRHSDDRPTSPLPYLTNEATQLIMVVMVITIVARGADYLMDFLGIATISTVIDIEGALSSIIWVTLCWSAAALVLIGKYLHIDKAIIAGSVIATATYSGLTTGAAIDMFDDGFSGVRIVSTYLLPATLWAMTAYSAVISREADRRATKH